MNLKDVAAGNKFPARNDLPQAEVLNRILIETGGIAKINFPVGFAGNPVAGFEIMKIFRRFPSGCRGWTKPEP
jgi:hypothetical protein